jgi:hypothetical protein
MRRREAGSMILWITECKLLLGTSWEGVPHRKSLWIPLGSRESGLPLHSLTHPSPIELLGS